MFSKSKWWIFVLAFSFLATNWLPAAHAQDKQAKAKESKKNENVAIVNGVKISTAEFDREVGRYEQQMAMMGQQPSPEQMTEIKNKDTTLSFFFMNIELITPKAKMIGACYSRKLWVLPL